MNAEQKYHLDRIFEAHPGLKHYDELGKRAAACAPQSANDLAMAWGRSHPTFEAHPVGSSDLLSVVTADAPTDDSDVDTLLFVDVDEVFRDSAGTMMRAAGVEVDRMNNLGFQETFDTEELTTPRGTADHIVLGMIAADYMDPMDDITASQAALAELQREDHAVSWKTARIIGITSTLAGGEAATMKFMYEHAQKTLSGFGFNGDYTEGARVKKSDIMLQFIEYFTGKGADIQAVLYIDDSMSHIADFRAHVVPHVPFAADTTPIHALNKFPTVDDMYGVAHKLRHSSSPSEGLSQLVQQVKTRRHDEG